MKDISQKRKRFMDSHRLMNQSKVFSGKTHKSVVDIMEENKLPRQLLTEN